MVAKVEQSERAQKVSLALPLELRKPVVSFSNLAIVFFAFSLPQQQQRTGKM